MEKELNYKGIIVRPRTVTFEEYAEQVKDYYKKLRYDVSNFSASVRGYWDRQKNWFAYFPNGRVVRFPKNNFDRLDKIISRVEKENTTEYGKFAAMMQRIIEQKLGSRNYLIYPTTYGIGLWAIYNFHFEDDKSKIEEVLDGMGVEYYNEFSDANWAYRFKISKKEANRMLIASQI